MRISLQNAVRGLGEYMSEEFSQLTPSWANFGVVCFAEYKLKTQGVKLLKTFDNGDGFIDLDVFEELVNKYGRSLNDGSFKTAVGDITISKDTPQQIMQYLKKYGEN